MKHTIRFIFLLLTLVIVGASNVEAALDQSDIIIGSILPNASAGQVQVAVSGTTVTLTVTPASGYKTKKSLIIAEKMVDPTGLSTQSISPGIAQFTLTGPDGWITEATEFTFTVPAGYDGAYITVTFVSATTAATAITSLSEITDFSADAKYELAADIDASGLNESLDEFKGTLDGKLHKIYNLRKPLFASTDGAIIRNITFESVSISSGDTDGDAGAVTSKAKGATRIYNCGILPSSVERDNEGNITGFSGSSVGGTGNVGGLVGTLSGTARVINCYSYANITGGNVVGGIVGNNTGTTTAASINTMVMNCMFYADITGGTTKSPVYGGARINNLQGGLNNFNYYSYENLKGGITEGQYNCALAVEEKYLNRFEFYRLLLNSNKKLCAFYITGNPGDANLMAKWVLETADRSISGRDPYPYPILKEQKYYPSIINPDFENAPDGSFVGRNHGGKLGKTLSVTISNTKTDGGQTWPNGANVSTTSLTLQRTDKDFDRFNYNYDKVQLPYYNDVGEGNYTGNRVVTGWKIVSITTLADDPYTAANYNYTKKYASDQAYFDYPNYNFADRKSSKKDLYSVSGRVFSQGAYFDVPYGVTSITIEPYWGKACYIADPNYDVVYKNDYTGKQNVTQTGTQVTVGTTLFDGQRIETTVANALKYIKDNLGGYGSTVYDNAVVLVGNLHLDNVPSGGGDPFTMMSVDEDNDHEPDYSLIYHHKSRTWIAPIRFDFLNIPGTAQAQKPYGASLICNFTIFKTKGWFEVTNTSSFYSSQLEYENQASGTKSDAPLILLGGVIDQFVSTQSSTVDGHTIYIHVGGNVWINEFGLGTHSDGGESTPHIPVSVTGGEFPGFYLTGTYKADAKVRTDNAECYISGGYIHEAAGASLEQINGNVRWQIFNADIENFFGGGINDAKPITGDITIDIYNSYVGLFCGGPKFGNMQGSKKVTTNAEGCTFGKYFGAGYGGTSIAKKKYYDLDSYDWTTLQGYYTTDRGKYFDGIKTNASQTSGKDYGKKGPGVATDFDYEFFVWSSGTTGARFFVKFASFSLAQCNDVSSTLKKCTVETNFYGGGNLGKVIGTATSVLEDCDVKGNVYGGGYSASLPTVEVRDAGFTKDPNYNSASGMFEPGVFSGTTTFTWENATAAGKTLSNGNSGSDLTNHILYTNTELTGLGEVAHTNLTINGTTTVGYSVYGGGEESGVGGNTTVNITSGTIGEQGKGGAEYGNVYGGGKGKAGNKDAGYVKGNTEVNVSQASNDKPTIIYHNIYGGGAYGSVGDFTYTSGMPTGLNTAETGKTNVNVTGGTIGWNGKENGMVYGSSRGDVATPTGSPAVDPNDCMAWVYNANVNIGTEGSSTGPAIKGSVYGSGENGHTFNDVEINIYSGTIGITEGSAIVDNNGTPEDPSDDKSYSGASYAYRGNVYGGGCGTDMYDSDSDGKEDKYNPLAGIVLGNTTVNVKGGQVVHNIYGAGAMGSVGTFKVADATYHSAHPDVPEGEQYVSSGGKTTIAISGGTIGVDGTSGEGNIFGAARGDKTATQAGLAQVKETEVTVSGGTVMGNVYGGGEIGNVVTFYETEDGRYLWTSGGKTTVAITGGKVGPDDNANPKIGNVFGAGKGEANTFKCEKGMVKETLLSINNGTVNGNVYGGGEVGRVEYDTDVKIGVGAGEGTFAPDIKGSVFGGGAGLETHGYSALVRGDTKVTVQGTSKVKHSVYGGGEIASVGRYGLDAQKMPSILLGGGNCTVNVKGSAIIGLDDSPGYVYGAGKGVSTPFDKDNADKSKRSRRMSVYNSTDYSDGEGTKWEYSEAYTDAQKADDSFMKFVWEYFQDEDTYSTYLETLALVTHPNVTIDESAQVKGSVFGGGELGLTKGSVEVNINGGTIKTDVYGGGSLASTNTTSTVAEGYPVTGVPAKDESGNYVTEIVHPTTTVNLKGGTIGRDAYGGGLGDATHTPFVDGNITVNLNKDVDDAAKGCIVNRVFGANNVNGTPKKNIEVHVYKTQNAAASKIAGTDEGADADHQPKVKGRYDVSAVYGGGNQAAYNPTTPYKPTDAPTGAKTQVIVEGCDRTSIETVYGGGNAAAVPETNVEILGSYEIGYLFGGGNGKDEIAPGVENPGADVGTLDHGTTTYGTGNANTLMVGGYIHEAYGGSNQKGIIKGSINQITDPKDPEDPECCLLEIEKIVGAGKYADIDGDVNMTLSCQPSKKVDLLFAGADEANVNGNITLNITNGHFGKVFGGNNLGGAIKGKITVNVQETGCQPIKIDNLYLGSNEAAYSVFGYWESEEIHPVTKRKILKPRESATDTHDPVPNPADDDKHTFPYAQPELNIISCTYIGNVFGGGLGEDAKMYANPTVNINMVQGLYAEDTTVGVPAKMTELGLNPESENAGRLGIIGNVFGGGDAADIIGNTTVNIATETGKGAYILGNVYGGGKGEADTFSCSKAMVGKNDEGKCEDPGSDGNKDKGTHVNIGNGLVKGSVYGGGKVGRVEWNTQVKIGVGEGDGPFAPEIKGNVFGAGAGVETHGYAALVRGNSSVTVQGSGKVRGNVYGGGEKATVGRYWVKDISDPTDLCGDESEAPTAPESLPSEMPYKTRRGGKCTVVVQGNALVGLDSETTETTGHVFGAGKGVLPEYVYNEGSSSTWSKRMVDYNSTKHTTGEHTTWDYSDDSHKYVWEYFTTEAKYLEFLQTLALVTGTDVTISGTPAVKGSVFGGSESGYVQDDTDVKVEGGTIGSEGKGSTYFGNVYGGGKGDAEHNGADKNYVAAGLVKGNTKVTISNGTILHNVYGGGAYGSVGEFTYDASGMPTGRVESTTGGKAEIIITGGTFGTTGKENGLIFGSSRGDVGAPGSIHDKLAWVYDTDVKIGTSGSGTDFTTPTIKGSVYGGGENGHILNDAKVNIYSGKIGIDDANDPDGGAAYLYRGNVYGAGCGTDKYYTGEIPDGHTATDGEGDSYNPLAGIVKGSTTVNISGGHVVHNVYGGGAMGQVGTITSSTKHESLTDGFGLSWPYELVYATYPNSDVKTGKATVTITGGRLGTDGDGNGYVYGAARGAVEVGENDIHKQRYVEALLANVRETEVIIEYDNTPTDDVVTIDPTTKATLITVNNTPCITGAVFGGGEDGHVYENAKIEIKNGLIGNSVYGGGRGKSTFKGKLKKQSDDSEYTTDINSWIAGKVYGDVDIIMTGGHVVRNIYGGGNLGSVGKGNYSSGADDYYPDGYGETLTGNLWTSGTTGDNAWHFLNSGKITVKVQGGTVGMENGVQDGLPVGCIFGSSRGRAAADVIDKYPRFEYAPDFYLGYANETEVEIGKSGVETGPTIWGSVYGGGRDGHVRRHTKVTVFGGTIGRECTSESNPTGIQWTERGNVFGSGSGMGMYDSNNDGTADKHGMSSGSVTGWTEVYIKGGKIYQNVYGGGALSSVGAPKLNQTSEEYRKGDTAAGHGIGKQTICSVNIEGGEIGTVAGFKKSYGGSVFAAGRGGGLISGEKAEDFATSVWSEVNVSGGTIYGSAFGGGEQGLVKCGVDVNMTGGEIKNDVYGGGAKAHTNTSNWDATNNTWADATAKSTKYTTAVNLKGGIVCNNAYGGGLGEATESAPAYVYGDVTLKLNEGVANTAKGCVVNQIFGANNALGSPKGDVTVHVYATQNNAATQIANAGAVTTAKVKERYDVKAVYGGGNEAAYEPVTPYNGTSGSKTTVIIDGCDLTSINTVYGGGNAAAVPETNIEIYGTYEIFNVFGGGNGKDKRIDGSDNPGADVGTLDHGTTTYGTGNANTLLGGGLIHEAYGGSNQKGVIKGSINQITDPDCSDCELEVEKIVGAGKYADIDGDVNLTLSCQPNKKVDLLFAGADEANVNGNITLNITNGHFGKVFGGNNLGGAIKGKITVNVQETGCQPIKIDNLYLGSNEAAYSRFGYWESEETHPVTGKKILKPRESADDEHQAVPNPPTDETHTFPYAQPELNIISCTYIGNVFGGGLGKKAKMYANPTVNVNMVPGKYANDATVGVPKVMTELGLAAYENPDKLGIIRNVYGGGDAADVEGNTTVKIATETGKGAYIIGSVFGGGNAADILGNTNVTMSGGYVFNGIFGGGYAGSVGKFTRSTAAADVNVYGHTAHEGCIGKPISCAEGTGKCTVLVNGGQIGPISVATQGMNRPAAQGGPVPEGWVWGGGQGLIDDPAHDPDTHFSSYVGSTDVTIAGTALVMESIIGGGEFGRVLGNTLVKIEGGQIGIGENMIDSDNKPIRYTDEQFVNPLTTTITSDKALAECSHFPYGRNIGTTENPNWVYLPYDPYYETYPEYVTAHPEFGPASTSNPSDGKTWIGCVFAGGSGYMPYVKKDNSGYGWCLSAGLVEGNSEVRISGGHILTNVYGGNEITDVKGKSIVKMTGGTIGVPRTLEQIIAHPLTCYLFGAGKGDERPRFYDFTNVGNVEVEISGGIIYGSVFGGSEDGHVAGDVKMDIKPGAVIGTWGTSYVDGNVFGGGRGFSGNTLTAGLVGGNVTMNVTGGNILGSIYGGGRLASVGTYLVPTNNANYGKLVPDTENEKHGHIAINISGGTIGNNYEYIMPANTDNWTAADWKTWKTTNHVPNTEFGTTDTDKNRLMHTKGGNVFAGSMGRLYALDGSTVLDKWADLGKAKKTEVTISGGTVKSNVYGGGELGAVINGTKVTITGGTVGGEVGTGDTQYTYGSVFGGGYGSDANVAGTYTTVEETSAVSVKDWAGRVKSGTLVEMKAGDTTTGKVMASIYGGGELAWVDGSTQVTVSAGEIGKNELREGGYTKFGGYRMGNVFGGGKGSLDYVKAGLVTKNTNVTISGTTETTKIYHNIYGGGALGSVGTFTYDANLMPTGMSDTNTGTATVKIIGGLIGINGHDNGMINGSSRGGEGNPSVTPNLDRVAWVKNTLVEIGRNGDSEAANANAPVAIMGSVYGGGENGHNLQNASVAVYGGTIGNPTPSGGYDCGNIYGAGCGTDTYTIGNDPTEHHNPMAGIVCGNTSVVIIGGKVMKNIYGGGSMGSVGTDDVPTSGATSVTINGGVVGTDDNDNTNVYGGPKGSIEDTDVIAHVRETQVNINYPADIRGSVFGGGEAGIVNEGVVVNINGGKIKNDVYGGGALANTNVSNTLVTPPSPLAKTVVNLHGGSINHNVYGGALGRLAKGTEGDEGYISPIQAKVYGDVLVELNGKKTVASETVSWLDSCVVKNEIFGCNNLNGCPQRAVTVHVFKTVGYEGHVGTVAEKLDSDNPNDHSYHLKAVYGGGNLAAFMPDVKAVADTVQARVIIDGCDMTSIETVYGGGNAASAPATNVTINGTYEISELFGGGNGKDDIYPNGVQTANPGANVGFKDYSAVENVYDTKEKRQQDDFVNEYVYGSGKAAVNVFGGRIHRVFGGSNTKGNVRMTAVTLLDESSGCDFCVDEAYGGGKSALMDAEAQLLLACIPGLRAVYGGAEAADVHGNVTLNITNGTFDRVFGGNNLSGTIGGSITVNVEEIGCKPVMIGELYGGGNQAGYSVYGYDAQGKPKESGTRLYDDPQVNVMSFTSIGNIYGGGYGGGATMVGNPTVNVNVAYGRWYDNDISVVPENTKIRKTYPIPSHAKGKMGAINNVFGGGNAAKVMGNTVVNVATLEVVYVVKQFAVGDPVTGYYTRNNAGEYLAATGTAVDGTTYYEQKDVLGADIRGDVFGGGNEAEVTGNANVTIGR